MRSTKLEAVRGILERLISYPTVSIDSNLDLISYAADRLERAGARLTVSNDPSGTKANLFATLGPDRDGGIVLSGHTDVVPALTEEWRTDPFELVARDGNLFGRGTCDMKGFIACVLAKMEDYSRLDLQRPVHVALTYDEEVGCLGARQLVGELETSGKKPAIAIIGEPTDMKVIEGHKGCYEYTTCFHGTDGHGSEPDKGVNAIHFAAAYIARMLELAARMKERVGPDSAHFSPPWTTLQTGRIEGGSARNVIARHCAVEWEMRPVRSSDAAEIKTALEDYTRNVLLPQMKTVYPEADIVTEVIGEVAGLAVMPENEARELVMSLTGANLTDVVSFGTEAGLFQSLGMSVVVCGPGSIAQAHQPDEFVSEDQLARCLSMLDGLERTLVQSA
ncbi:MAG: acetylornithine deacetylase [Roseibium sp.]|uniref:acetylornithine deacetylase n=1 Tax=Roseibium sp. TaxID=1936156 RepID=UPI001B00D1CB|nr:acetylornithine deacetylase [Roseibium sp.]MBO6895435.1 acetylornithine deacetylase [Roseibium sp.]MBO6929985.1 acetylornithine deacetylase [Roseibium sp.]